MRKLSSLVLWIFFWILSIWIFIVAVDAQSPTPVAIDVQIIESNSELTCDVYNNIKVGMTLPHFYAAIGKKLTRTAKDYDKVNEFIAINKWLIIYVFKGIVWRIEYKNLRLPCIYIYDSYSNSQKYLSPDGSISVIYDMTDGNTYITNIDIWYRVIQNN